MAEDLLHDGQALSLVQTVGSLYQNFGQVWSNQGLRKALQPQLERSSQLHACQDFFSNAVNVMQLIVLVLMPWLFCCASARGQSPMKPRSDAKVSRNPLQLIQTFTVSKMNLRWAAAEDKDLQREDLIA